MTIKIISTNRKAFHEYDVGDRYEAGIALSGTEVKALRATKINMNDGWVDIQRGEAFLKDTHIGHYDHGNLNNHLEKRPRKLLLHRNELAKLERGLSEKGYSIIPLKVYFKGSYIKVEIGLARGKKSHDKRESSKTKDADREIRRVMKERR